LFALAEGAGDPVEPVLFQRLIGRGEVGKPFLHLADAGAAADGLVVHPDVGVRQVVFKEPAFVEGRREGGPSALNRNGIGWGTGKGEQGGSRQQHQQLAPEHDRVLPQREHPVE
jgi:hypothetical protein